MNRVIHDLNKQIFKELEELSRFGREETGGVTRLAFSDSDREAKNYFVSLCQQEGLEVREDQAGNIIARRKGKKDYLPAVACGSHLDSVVNGGKYDGTLGVLAGLEVIRRLNRNNIETEHPLELISFAAEESSRFGVSTIGSKAMAGKLNITALSKLKDSQGISFSKAVEQHGLRMENFHLSKRETRELKAFLELHIEQGPVLEQSGNSIGIVTAIAAPTRYLVEINGRAGHSGTTIMTLRKDALAAAAEIVLSVEEIALQELENHLVGTVGVAHVYPGVANTIPEKVEMIVEFRSVYIQSKKSSQQQWLSKLKEIEARRGVQIGVQLLSEEEPVQLSDVLSANIMNVCQTKGYPFQEMISGAGHDAMNMVELCPVGLIFVPSVQGISHHPDEYTQERDILNGVDVLYETILKLACS